MFSHYNPIDFRFGCGAAGLVGAQAKTLGRHALIVTGRSSTKKSGLLDQICAQLKAEDLRCIIFDAIDENPTTTIVEEGARLIKKTGADLVIGLGGGSAIDAAKGIAFAAVNHGDLSDYIFGRAAGTGALPFLAVPTTAGTGTEGNCLAVLTNPETKDKKSLRSPHIFPKVSIVDPLLLKTQPSPVLASTSFDALCHAVEAYTSRGATPYTDMISRTAIRLIGENLPKLFDGGETDDSVWSALSYASTLGGIAIGEAGVTLCHGLEHSVSGLLNVRHGEGLAALTLICLEHNIPADPAKHADIAALLGSPAHSCLDAVRDLMRKIGISFTLGELGVREEDIPWLTQNSLKTMSYALSNSPNPVDEDRIAGLYRRALGKV